MRTLIIGLDGGEWGVINQLLEKGRLPNVASLIENGQSGDLESTMPPVSPLAWNSIYTGTNPGKHGVYDFSELENDYSFRSVSSHDRQAVPFWEVLNDHSVSTGLFKTPFTYPVDSVTGFFVAGFPLPSRSEDAVYPERLEASVGEPIDLVEDTSLISEGHLSDLRDDLHSTVRYQTDVLLEILDQQSVNTLMTVYDGADRIQHYYWKHMDPSHTRYDPSQFDDAIHKYYEIFDEQVGRLLRHTTQETNVLLLSDHGFGPLEFDVNVERWLSDNGYLEWSDRSREQTETRDLSGRIVWAVWTLFKKLGVDDLVRSVLPRSVVEKGRAASSKRKTNYDWSQTDAFFSSVSGQSIFINLAARFDEGSVDEDEYDVTVDAIVDGLRSLTDPESGTRLIESVVRGDELYEGGATDGAPDIVLNAADRYAITGGPNTELFSKSTKEGIDRSGDHDRTGIFVASGPDFATGDHLTDTLSVVDIAPIVLHLHDCPLPRHFDGSLPEQIFASQDPRQQADYTDEYGPKSRDEYQWNDDEQAQLQENLRDLGYFE